MRVLGNSRFKRFTGQKNTPIAISIVLIILVILLLFISKNENIGLIQNIRAKSEALIYNLSTTVSYPVQIVKNGVDSIRDLKNIYSENKRFKSKQFLESVSFQEMMTLKLKIAEYEKLLNATKDIEYSYVTSRVVADFSKKFNSTLIINAGNKDHIYLDMPVIGTNGLVGRVSSVSNKIARVLLINNINSRSPVNISGNDFQGILIGQGPENPIIQFVDEIERVSIGDLVSSSGKGGIFPPNILIGQIVNKFSNRLEVELFEDFEKLSHVRLIEYKISR